MGVARVTLSDPPAMPQDRSQAEREKRVAGRGNVPLGSEPSERRLIPLGQPLGDQPPLTASRVPRGPTLRGW